MLSLVNSTTADKLTKDRKQVSDQLLSSTSPFNQTLLNIYSHFCTNMILQIQNSIELILFTF